MEKRSASNVNRFCLVFWCAQSLPGRATPVPGGRAVLCSVVNLWSSGAVLFVPLVLAANKRSGSADRPYGYCTHLLEAGKLLHAVI